MDSMIDWDVPDHRRPTQLALTAENGTLKGRKVIQLSSHAQSGLRGGAIKNGHLVLRLSENLNIS